MGIDTFQYAVKHPYEKLTGSEEEVISMCVDNILHLLDNRNSYRDELTRSVINNNLVFEKLARAYSNKLHPSIEKIIVPTYVYWLMPYCKINSRVAEEIYEKLWNKNGAVGED